MGAPALVATYGPASLQTAQTVTTSVTCAVGDTLVVVGTTGGSTRNIGTPTGGTGLTWTAQVALAAASNSPVYIYTAPVTTAQTFTISLTTSGTAGASTTVPWMYQVLRFSGVTAINE